MALNTSLAVPEHNQRTFAKNWDHEVQQRISKLRGKFTVKEFEGKEHVFSDLDDVEFSEDAGRLSRSNPTEWTGKKRKIVKRNFDVQKLFDKNDAEFLGMLTEPTSELIEAMGFAWDRKIDELSILAASATAFGGADPFDTQITLPSTQQVAVNYVPTGSPANSGLTPEKIIRARTIFAKNEIFPSDDELFLVVSPDDLEDLTTYVKSAGNDVWASMVAAYEKDPSEKLFQFTVIQSNRLTLATGTDIETVVAFSKRHGIVVAPEKMRTEIDILPEKKHAKMISCYAQYGAVRRQEKGVVEIFCDQSP